MMKTRKMVLLGGLLVIGLVVLYTGSAHATAGDIGDSFTVRYFNQAGIAQPDTYSNSVYVSVMVGPRLTLTKQQKRNRDMGASGFVTTLFTVTSQDSVTYRLRINNAAFSDTATGLTVVDTWTFWNAAALSESVTFLDSDGTAGNSTIDTGSSLTFGLGKVTNFQYTTDAAYAEGSWIDTTVAGLKACADNVNRRILGIRWKIDKFIGSDAGIQDNIFFTVRFP